MRPLAWLLAAGVLAPAALAFPAPSGQDKQEKKEEKPEKKEAAEAGHAGAPNLEAKDLDELGPYADSLATAQLDDETTGDLLVQEIRVRTMRARAHGPGPEAGAPEAKHEPLMAFVKARIAEGKKGADLAAAIKAEVEKRRSEMTPPGAGPGAGHGFERDGERMKAVRVAAAEIVKKLRTENLKGRPFVEAFVKAHRERMEKMREERQEKREEKAKEKPKDGEKKSG